MKTIVGLLPQEENATQTVHALERAGFAPQSVTVLRSVRAMWRYLACRPAKIVSRDFGIGAALGVAIYAFFGAIVAVGEAMLGFDRVLALQALLIFVIVGVYVGGLLGVFFGMGASEQRNRSYLSGIRRGGVLVAVRTADEHSARALEALQHAGAQDVQLCLSRQDEQESEDVAFAKQDRLAGWLRMAARGLGIALFVLVLSLFIGEGLSGEALPNLLTMTVSEDFLLVALLMTLLGVLLALRWEGIGGLTIVGSVLLFEGINTIAGGYWRISLINALFLLVGLLFLYLWWRRETRMPESPNGLNIRAEEIGDKHVSTHA